MAWTEVPLPHGYGWAMLRAGRDAHVVPVGDLIEHELTERCVCVPSSRLIPAHDGDIWQLIHNSLDGREADEDDDE